MKLPVFIMHSFKYFEQNSSHYAYSGMYAYLLFVKIPLCTLIRDVRLFGRLEYICDKEKNSSKGTTWINVLKSWNFAWIYSLALDNRFMQNSSLG